MTNESHPRRRVEPEPADRTIVDWKEMAAWWDERQGDEGDLWHRTLIDPTLFKVLGPVKGQHVLDLACGKGYIARKLARSGARVTGVEASTPIVEHARSREEREALGIVYHVADAARLDGLGDAGFDVVMCNMALMDVPDAEGALPEAARVVRPGGRLVASLSHPCFDVSVSSSGWVVERVGFQTTVFRKVSHYRRVGVRALDTLARRSGPGMVDAGLPPPAILLLPGTAWAGFVVSAFEEPEPAEEFMAEDPQGAWIEQIPLQCVIEAYKFKP